MTSVPPISSLRSLNAPVVATVGRIAALAHENVATIGTGTRLGEPQRVAIALRYADMVDEFSSLTKSTNELQAKGQLALPKGAIQSAIQGEKLLHKFFTSFGKYENAADKAGARQAISAAADVLASRMSTAHTKLNFALQAVSDKPPFKINGTSKSPWATGGGSTSTSSSSSPSSTSSYAYVDGQVIDGLTGMPPRGYGSSAGPDDAYDPMFSRSPGSSYEGFSGPDGYTSAGFLG